MTIPVAMIIMALLNIMQAREIEEEKTRKRTNC
jgi:hypothetical protein